MPLFVTCTTIIGVRELAHFNVLHGCKTIIVHDYEWKRGEYFGISPVHHLYFQLVLQRYQLNLLMPGGNNKVTHT